MPPTGLQGSNYPISQSYNYYSYYRRADFELPDVFVREERFTREIVEAFEYCYEVFHTCDLAVNGVWGSTDGDDRGFTVAPDYLFPGATERSPINATTYAIAMEIIDRKDENGYVLGGGKLKEALRRTLGLGECFLEIGIERDGKNYVVSDLMYLPTYEMFRVEDIHGRIERFEQRKTIRDDDAIKLAPGKVVHMRRNPKGKYGRSCWQPAIATGVWQGLKDAADYLAHAARDVGINPDVHEMPEGMTASQIDQYKAKQEREALEGLKTRLYTAPGGAISKLGSGNSSLQALIDNFLQWRYRMTLPGMPGYFWMGMSDGSQRELSAQPAFQHARWRNEWCALVTEAIKQVIDLEIEIRMGKEFLLSPDGKYDIIWPHWNVSLEAGAGNGDDESAAAGFSETDENDDSDLGDTDDASNQLSTRRPRPTPYRSTVSRRHR